MREKFKKWRNKLTLKQKVIISIAGIIIYALLYCYCECLLKNDSTTMFVRAIAALVHVISEIIIILFILCVIICPPVAILLIQGDKRLLKLYEEKLSKDQFTEVLFKSEIQIPEGAAGELYWDMKHCAAPQWFAKWQDEEDKIDLVLKDNGKIVRTWTKSIYFVNEFFEFKE